MQPDLAALHHNLGNALRALGRLVEARAAYLEALRLDPNLALAHAHLGLILQQRGPARRCPALAEAGRRAGAGQRRLLGIPGRAARRAGGARRGDPLLGARAGPGPGRGRARTSSLGWALQEEGRLAEAGEHYRAAARLQPDFGRGPAQPGRAARGAGRAGRGRGRLPRGAAACSRPSPCPTPGWRRCCAASCPTPTCAALEAAAGRPAAGPRAPRPAALRPGPRPRRPRRLRPRRRLPAPGQRPDAWSWRRAAREYVAGRARAVRRRPAPGVRAATSSRRIAGAGLGHAPAGLRLRPAALGHDADRAGAGQPLRASTAPASCGWPGRSFEAIPAVAGPLRARRWTASPTSTPAPSAAWPSGTSTACETLDGGRAERDRGQDARQLPVSRPAGGPVPQRRLHPLPPRPARRGRLVLDDRLPQHPLGQRSRAHRLAASGNTAG